MMRTSTRWASISRRLALLAVLAAPTALPAEAAPAACGADDRLAGRVATGVAKPLPALARLTDGQVLSEGAAWTSAGAVPLGAAEHLAFDLGDALPLRALLVQADANDSYLVEGSLDGIAFQRLGLLPKLGELDGLRTRALRLGGAPVRHLRLGITAGDGRAAVAEIQAFCVAPGEWRPRLEVISAPPDRGAEPRGLRWDDVTSRWWELALAIAGLALLAADARRERRARPDAGLARRRQVAFTVTGLVAVLTYFNFGAFHFGSFVHGWDTFHYYIGAKYFRELGYERLYDCVAVADAGEPALASAVEGRKLRNLRSNILESTAGILADPVRCTGHFTAARWREFRHDIAWFRERESAERWAAISSDHGYNATPVWNVAGSLLANLAPASDRQILLLCLLDPLYFAALAAALVWAFGRPGAAVALLVLATSFPARFYWTGGAFLRWDWLCFTVLAVCCLRRGRPFAAGAALGYAALLRVFPVLLAVGPALVVLSALVEAARSAGGAGRWRAVVDALGARHLAAERRFFAGALLAGALLVPASLVVGGSDAYRGFVANTRKHQATPLTNNMGLRTVLTYRPSEIGRELHSEAASDPWGRWKAARLAAWQSSRWLAAAVAAAALLLVARGAWRAREPWIALALAGAWIPFAVEMTSYYYAFLVVPALLWTVRRPAGLLLLASGAFSLWISLAPFAGMPTWRDEQYTWISLATVVTLLALLATFAFSAAPVPAGAPVCLSPPTGRAEAPRRADRPALRNRKELRT